MTLMAKDMRMTSGSGGTRTSLLDLPLTILDDIVLAVHQMIEYDGYLCDMRLVNKRFNECVLHSLAFRTRPRDLYLICYQFETQSFRIPKCRAHGIHNSFYARTILQGRIGSRTEQDCRLLAFYQALNEALAIFRADLSQSTEFFQVTRSQIQNGSPRQFSSANSTLADQVTILFCDAVITLFQITRRGYPITRYHRLEDGIHRREPEFWVRNLACYLGDVELLNKHSCNEYSVVKSPNCLASESEELLTMTATRGHEALLRDMLARVPLQHTDLAYAVCGACCSGKLQILNLILGAVPSEQIPALCSRSLLQFCCALRPGSGYTTVAEQVVNRCDSDHSDRQLNTILVAQVNLGAVRIIRLLLHRFGNRKFWPFSRVWRPQFSPLWSACINGDLQCVQSLVRDGYLASARCEDDVWRLCYECLEVAAYANSLSICQELCQYLDRDLESMDICLLAGIDGSIDVMNKKLVANPKLLDTIEKFGDRIYTVGQAALKRAAERLRVENVSYFLQKGIRSDGCDIWSHFKIEWRFRRLHKQEYQKVQKLLKEHGMPELQVDL